VGEPFVHTLRVRYSECDPQGVLFNANYLAYVDHTITELWRAAYGGYQTMLDRGIDIVVAEANLRFLGAARFDELITLERSSPTSAPPACAPPTASAATASCCSRPRSGTCSSTGAPRPRRRFRNGRARDGAWVIPEPARP